jgi:hypothetical protein
LGPIESCHDLTVLVLPIAFMIRKNLTCDKLREF